MKHPFPSRRRSLAMLALPWAAFGILTLTGAKSEPEGILGDKDLQGPTKLGDIPPGTAQAFGGVFKGKVCNKTDWSANDLAFEVTGGSATRVEIYSNTVPPTKIGEQNFGDPPTAPGVAHFKFPAGEKMADDACVQYKLIGVTGTGTGLISLFCSPSDDPGPGGTLAGPVDVLESYPLDRISNLARRGISRSFNPGVASNVINRDTSQRLTALAGRVAVLGQPEASITGIRLFLPSGVDWTDAQVAYSGLSFTASDLPPLLTDDWLRGYVQLNAEVVGHPIRLDLEATHAP